MRIRRLFSIMYMCNVLWAQTAGTVKGTVIDEQGKPISKAEVHIASTKRLFGSRVINFYTTNNNGKFVIEHVPWGTYTVLAGKEASGYPDTKLAFYSNLSVPVVILAPAFPNADVIVPLGPPAARLDIVGLTDALTNKKIGSGAVTLRRLDNPNFFITTSTVAKPILVPALTDVAIEIVAPGYKPWPAPDQAEQGRIRLKPEEVLKLEIKLQPENPRPLSPGQKP